MFNNLERRVRNIEERPKPQPQQPQQAQGGGATGAEGLRPEEYALLPRGSDERALLYARHQRNVTYYREGQEASEAAQGYVPQSDAQLAANAATAREFIRKGFRGQPPDFKIVN